MQSLSLKKNKLLIIKTKIKKNESTEYLGVLYMDYYIYYNIYAYNWSHMCLM